MSSHVEVDNTTKTLLGQYADLMNKHGAESEQARAFFEKHVEGNAKLKGLVQTAKLLRLKLDQVQTQ